jgi:hypothetical protein
LLAQHIQQTFHRECLKRVLLSLTVQPISIFSDKKLPQWPQCFSVFLCGFSLRLAPLREISRCEIKTFTQRRQVAKTRKVKLRRYPSSAYGSISLIHHFRQSAESD